jgi:hypothetical protein
LQRLVQGRELVRDPYEALGGLEPTVEGVYLVAEAVETLEDRVELPVVELVALRHWS